MAKTGKSVKIITYKQGVTGSNPVAPTHKINHLQRFSR